MRAHPVLRTPKSVDSDHARHLGQHCYVAKHADAYPQDTDAPRNNAIEHSPQLRACFRRSDPGFESLSSTKESPGQRPGGSLLERSDQRPIVPNSVLPRPRTPPMRRSDGRLADDVIATNWSLPMKVFERGLDKGSNAFGMSSSRQLSRTFAPQRRRQPWASITATTS
jgi:hypothetical protein